MSSQEHDRFHRKWNRRLSEAALRISKPRIPSNTLRGAAQIVGPLRRGRSLRSRTVQGGVEIPHYWALYVHDGRRPFRKGRYMVWFRNPNRDPRLRGGKTPKRKNQLRYLSRAQWKDALQLNADWLEAGGDPYLSPVIITKEIKRATPGAFFFENDGGMHRMSSTTARLSKEMFSRHVKEFLGEFLRIEEELVLVIG